MTALDVVSRYTPSHWKQHTYNNNVYIKVTLKKETEEYKKIENMIKGFFSNLTVSSIERVQHPFAFGRFCIRKQQLTLINKCDPTVKQLELFITDTKKIDLILRHNCDNRRGGFTEKHVINPNGLILIVKVLDVANDRDSDRYPEYLIRYTYHKIKPQSGASSLKHNPTASQQCNSIPYENTSTSTPRNDSMEPLRSIQPHNVDLIVSNAVIRPQSGASSLKHNPTASQQCNSIPYENISTSTPRNDSVEPLRSIQPHNVDLIVSNAVRRLQSYGERSLEHILMASQQDIPTHYEITSTTARPVYYRDWSIEDHLKNFQPNCMFKRNVFSQQPARASYQRTAGNDDYFKCILL